MPVTLEQGEGRCAIRLEGEIGVALAAELKAVLLQARSLGGLVALDMQGVTELDISALQLLWAGEREVRKSGRSLTLAAPVPADILAIFSEAGFEKFPLTMPAK